MVTNYKETLEFLFSQLPMFQRTGAAAYKANLNNTISLCEMLGNPEEDIPAIHVAGTNGKGSVSHMITSALLEQGYKVGLYTSPHLTDFRERITVNGKKISEQEVVEFVNTYTNQFVHVNPSFFEITFAMALWHFKKQKVKIAVFETGMGGRLDSTNVVSSILSVITNIGHDHQQFLGDSLEEIAGEKAGIIKHKIPVVIGQSLPETEEVFLNKAEIEKAPILFAEEHVSIEEIQSVTPPYEDIPAFKEYKLKSRQEKIPTEIFTGLMGNYQESNIKTAVVALVMLKNTHFPVSTTSIKEGMKNVIKNTSLRGRWQIISSTPTIVCDTGHNKEGVKEVVKMIKNTSYKNLHLVLGVVNDKEAGNILREFPRNADFYFCKADIPRSLDAEILYQTAVDLGFKKINLCSTVSKAYEKAVASAGEKDMVFIGGSTFVVADLLEYLGK